MFLISLHENERLLRDQSPQLIHGDYLGNVCRGEDIQAKCDDVRNPMRENEQPAPILDPFSSCQRFSCDLPPLDSEEAGSAIVRGMPRSCEPDYFFADDGHEFSFGLHQIIATAGIDGYFLDDQISD